MARSAAAAYIQMASWSTAVAYKFCNRGGRRGRGRGEGGRRGREEGGGWESETENSCIHTAVQTKDHVKCE